MNAKIVSLPAEEKSRDRLCEHLFKDVVNWKLIQKTHWHDIMQVVLPIKAGKLLLSVLLRKLGSYSRKNRLYQRCAKTGTSNTDDLSVAVHFKSMTSL